ncbi:MAG: DEAD/DEAH box helicase family protein, partial [Salinispira sp.]
MKSYLLSDPQYSTTLKHVWMWNEFPSRKDFGGQDIGIDLVAETEEGEYWAIQCKCYQEKSQINKKEVDSFLSASSKQFQHEQTLSTVAFSHRLWISTTNRWGATAEETIKNQNPPVSRLNQHELARAPVSWKEIEQGVTGRPARLKRKKLRDHQKEAVEKTSSYFKEHDRGKLIMACGTGKTFTSLKIAEKETNGSGFILFLVPSIALLGQTLREWSAEAEEDISPIAICSDPKSTRKIQNDDADSTSVTDLAFPASTKVDTIIHQLYLLEKSHNAGLKVVFSTYQSIDVIAEAQKRYIPLSQGSRLREFDLIICDEAHRTTGVALTKEDSSAFIKVHDNNFIRAKKRLYMTATPRLYSEGSKAKAAMSDAILCSMDDEPYYGKEIYRIGFGESVEKNLLSDYKVLILTLSEGDVPESIQNMIVNEEQEINADDAAKLIGCINALSKQILGDEGTIKAADPNPMQRALAFCQTIKISKHITNIFNSTAGVYIDSLAREKQQTVSLIESKHIDGTMSAPERDNLLGWLKSDTGNECKILTNVRCLSEGIDVPSLDAVLFLSARNSQIDVVQSVGRVMRKAAGKKYGYIIIPVLVPSHAEPSKALDDNKRYKVVWSVLNALRAHDDRFNATI